MFPIVRDGPTRTFDTPVQAESEQTAQDESDNAVSIEPLSESLDLGVLDLIEQRRMANSTESMAVDSASQVLLANRAFILNFFGLAALIVALALNWQATLAAKTSADAAKVSADAAIASLGQKRAWIASYGIAETPKEKLHPDWYTQYETTWKNAGETPALNVAAYHRMEGFHADEIAGPFSIYPHDRDSIGQLGTLGPGAEHKGYMPFQNIHLENLLSFKIRYFLFTIIRYQTTYDKPGEWHITESVDELIAIVQPIPERFKMVAGGDVHLIIQINSFGQQQRST